MKTRRIFLAAVLLALIVPLAAPLALGNKKVDCAQIGKGPAYYLFFFNQLPGFEKLGAEAVPVVSAMVQKSLQEKISALPGTPVDLSAPPVSLTQAQAVKLKLGGADYSFQGKPIAEAMAKGGNGYAYCLLFYTATAGPKDLTRLYTSSMEELPAIDLNSNGQTVKVFNFISMQLTILDASGKEAAKGKEMMFSYRDWFGKKYPAFMSGQTDQLPEGVDYNSAASYALFISENMQAVFDALPEHKALAACPKGPKP